MNKKEIYALLGTRNIWHEVTEHKAVYNMAEVAEIHLPYRSMNDTRTTPSCFRHPAPVATGVRTQCPESTGSC